MGRQAGAFAGHDGGSVRERPDCPGGRITSDSSEVLMPESVAEALWQQYGGAIRMRDNARAPVPTSSGPRRCGKCPRRPGTPTSASSGSMAAHALPWLERYLEAPREERFGSLSCAGRSPRRSIQGGSARRAGHAAAAVPRSAAESQRHRPASSVAYEWVAAEPISYMELQTYNLRHFQEHAAQLNLFLGQPRHPGRSTRLGQPRRRLSNAILRPPIWLGHGPCPERHGDPDRIRTDDLHLDRVAC